jgi:hypothetical protein
LLAANGYAGPYVCVLNYFPYADSFAPLSNTLVIPADRIKPLMDEGYYASSALPGAPMPQNAQVTTYMPNPSILPTPLPTGESNQPQSVGFVISLGGNVVEFVEGMDAVTAFSYLDPTGNYIFRVLTRFALKLMDPGAIVRLEFQ